MARFDELGRVLRALRCERGPTQQQLAAAAGVSKYSVQVYESGARRPRSATLEPLLAALCLDRSAFRLLLTGTPGFAAAPASLRRRKTHRWRNWGWRQPDALAGFRSMLESTALRASRGGRR